MSAKSITTKVLVIALLLTAVQPARAEEPLADKVKKALRSGTEYLKKRQDKDRNGQWNWENSALLSQIWSGGASCLATLALLTAGEKPTEPVIRNAMPYIRSLKPSQTYVVALQTMVLAEVGEAKDLNIIQNNVNFLLAGRIFRGNGNDRELMGWSYGKEGHMEADNSNTQYAMLGLLAGRQAGVKIASEDWDGIQKFYIRTQRKQQDFGWWNYRPGSNEGPMHTMTCAGLSGLFISSLETNNDQQKLNEKTGVAANCGKYEENEAIARGMKWLAAHFTFETKLEKQRGATFYNLYGIERIGRQSGQRFIGDHDWYREGCELLCGVTPSESGLAQKEDGSWHMGSSFDNMPVISTSFAMLFLSKGRTPILISKLAFDGKDNNRFDWNHKHNDARHLVEYASHALFRKQPLAWQVFDPRLADIETEDKMKEELSNLLQSPILYMTGHAAPNLPPQQIKLLRRYLDEGGFIFAEACCGSQAFTDGFRQLMDRVYETKSVLTTMPANHAIWTAHMPLDPSDFAEGRDAGHMIQCIERGCKTVVVFSPQPLAGYWEESKFMPKNDLPPANRGELAYRFAGNVIAYATGLEMPKPRLTKMEVAERIDEKDIPRHMIKLAQLQHSGDWEPAPQALRNLATYLRSQYQLDVALTKEAISLSKADLLQYKFMYMHGRRDFMKSPIPDRDAIDPEDLSNVRNNLRTGATLFADACCGSGEFDKAFRAFVSKLYPDKKLEPIPLDDYLYSEKLNGRKIGKVKCRRGEAAGVAEYEEVDPQLEGIKLGDRWAIIYSKYDIGCALEKSKSSACKGYDHESAKTLAAAAVLYWLRK